MPSARAEHQQKLQPLAVWAATNSFGVPAGCQSSGYLWVVIMLRTRCTGSHSQTFTYIHICVDLDASTSWSWQFGEVQSAIAAHCFKCNEITHRQAQR